MGSVPGEDTILRVAEELAAHGVSVHWLHRRSKRPVGADWQTTDTQSIDELRASYRRGYNIGLRPGEFSRTPYGYLHILDVDIRSEDLAQAALDEIWRLWPKYTEAPYVISGSGGASRHFYFFTDKPFGSVKLAHSDTFKLVFDERKQRQVKKWDWEIELFGSRKQVAIPPSIHPDSGENYRWGREIDWDLLELDIGPILPADKVAGWGARSEDDLTLDDDNDDLMAALKAEPMGLSEEEIGETLADLPEDWVEDRDTWLQVGQALHHEYQGSADGFDRWCEWSKASAKFDAKDSAVVWRSFGKRNLANPVRMATLIAAAGANRLARAHAELDLLDDTDDSIDLLALPAPEIDLLADLAAEPETIDLLADIAGPPPITPGASVAREPEVYDPDWASYLQRNEEGAIKPTVHNVELIVRNDKRFRGVIGFNQFTQEQMQIGRPRRFKLKKESPKPIRQLEGTIWDLGDPVNGDLWTESQDHDFRIVLEAPERQGGYGLKTSDRDLRAALDKVAHRNSYHPVREYLNGLKWDGTPRAETLFIDYLGAPDDPYHREAARVWLMAAVTRIFEPGHKFDFVPILEGAQGKRKSTFIECLGVNWSGELTGDFHDTKGMVELMQGAWIMEMPELQGFSKAEVTLIKGFISKRKDKVRLAYAKRAAEFLRQCVFMGSTNEIEYLRDSTGGRRFWPISCRVIEIDTDRLTRNIDQIWAEVRFLYGVARQMQPYGALPLYMTNPVAAAYAKELQESRRQHGNDDVLAAQIENWLSQPIGSELGLDDLDGVEPEYRSKTCLLDIWENMMGRDRHAYGERDQQLLGRAMNKVRGWTKCGQSRFAKYGKQNVYVRDETPTEIVI